MPPRQPKRRAQPQSESGSPVDARQRALRQEEEKLKQRMEQLQRVIKDGPKLAEAAEKRRREELVARSVAGTRRVDAPTRLDTRFDASVADVVETRPRPRRRALRRQQRQARLMFCGLLIGLAILVFWLWTVWKW